MKTDVVNSKSQKTMVDRITIYFLHTQFGTSKKVARAQLHLLKILLGVAHFFKLKGSAASWCFYCFSRPTIHPLSFATVRHRSVFLPELQMHSLLSFFKELEGKRQYKKDRNMFLKVLRAITSTGLCTKV